MVRLYFDKSAGSYVVQTTCLDTENFVFELSEALAEVMSTADSGASACFGVLEQAMPIAFKLSGYKADEVREQRTLVCGHVSPESCDLLGAYGK